MEDQLRNIYNPADKYIRADIPNAEATSTICDFLSNGIKMRLSGSDLNASGGTYIWFGIKKNGGNLAA